MKAFVTGGTGFIGNRLAKQLRERDYDVICLVRKPERADELKELGATLVQGDITDKASMRDGMAGADVVFHVSGWYEVGLSPSAQERMEQINVSGTENVLGLATELDIPKIVYTSTTGVLGDTRGQVVDETHERDSPFDSAYDRTKYEAHQIAERYIFEGAPIIIVMPTQVYGPGDHSVVATYLRLLLRRSLPVVVAAETGFTLVHVDDLARGHILAAEKGEIGQSYLLGGDVMTVGEALQLAARLAGVPPPYLLLSSRWADPLVPLAERLEGRVTLPATLSPETLRSMGTTWWVTSAKAERELGYTHRTLEEGMAETVLWEMDRMGSPPLLVQPRMMLVLAVAAGVLSLGLLWKRRGNQ
jgi:dihydroflavonol-4-reductase